MDFLGIWIIQIVLIIVAEATGEEFETSGTFKFTVALVMRTTSLLTLLIHNNKIKMELSRISALQHRHARVVQDRTTVMLLEKQECTYTHSDIED